ILRICSTGRRARGAPAPNAPLPSPGDGLRWPTGMAQDARRMLRFSNFLFPESRDPAQDSRVIDESLAEARLCDALGVEVLWLAEHHFDGNCAYVDPVTFAAAVAATTTRIRLGFA